MKIFKSLAISLLGILGLASISYAGPFAVTGKFTTGTVTSCIFTLNSGTPITNEPVSVDASNSVCKLDVGTAINGNNNLSVQYKNMWGTSTSAPFLFTKAQPGTPSGIHLEE